MSPREAAWVWLVGLIGWFAIRLPYHRRARRIEVVAHRRSGRDRLALLLATFGVGVIPILYLATGAPRFAAYPFEPWMGWSGSVCQVLFLLLFALTHQQLGRQWSATLEIRAEHKLVTDGLYKYIRHPMYASFWLWALAQAFLLPNWVAGLAGLAGVAVLYFSRVPQEERLLREAFGAPYDDYATRTGRILPRFSGL